MRSFLELGVLGVTAVMADVYMKIRTHRKRSVSQCEENQMSIRRDVEL